MKRRRAIVPRLPFGDPDGSRAEIEDLISDFVALDGQEFPSGIGISDLDRTIRVIVGKKGSGKTVYLRRLQDAARKEDSIFASKISQDIPSTKSVVAFCQMFDPEKVTEAWQLAWRIALVRSALSQIICKKYFQTKVDVNVALEKLEKYRGFIPEYSVERSPYAELKELIGRFRKADKFWQHAQSNFWDDIQTILGTALKDCPPIFLYLDASDDEFAHAPMDWHRCQKGLFYAIMRFLRQSGTIGSRLHVVASIRDIAYSSVLQSEHRMRYVNAPSICLLDWNYDAISYFFDQKISALPGAYFNDRREDKGLTNFLKTDKIRNESRGCTEQIRNYLLRHTRCLPRDVIQVGNALAAIRIQHKSTTAKNWEDKIRNTVSRMAAMFADEQLQICANQLSSHEAPAFSAQLDYSDFYTSNVEYINEKKKIVKQYISLIERETFSYYDIEAADEAIAEFVPPGVKLSTILWQNGLIGTQQKKKPTEGFEFYSLGKNAGFTLPDNCAEYGFHSILIDVMPDIKITRAEPVQNMN